MSVWYADLRWLWREANGWIIMALVLKWYTTIMYWCLLRARTGKWPVSSVNSLLSGSSKRWSESVCSGAGRVREHSIRQASWGRACCVKRTCCWDCTRWSLIVSSVSGQYLWAMASMRPGIYRVKCGWLFHKVCCTLGRPRYRGCDCACA